MLVDIDRRRALFRCVDGKMTSLSYCKQCVHLKEEWLFWVECDHIAYRVMSDEVKKEYSSGIR